MYRLSKVILITFGSLFLVVLAAVVAVNLYVQSPSTKARIQEEISRALRVPIDITNASITPWGGLRIAGITVPGTTGNFLEASSFGARYQLLPLLKGKLIISTMVLDSPKIIWAQNEEGRWVLPALPDTGERKRAKDAAPDGAPPVQKTKKESGFVVKVEGFEIRDGSIELRDANGERVAAGTDVQMKYDFPRPDLAQGVITMRRLTWRDSLVFTNVESPFSYCKGELTFPSLQAVFGGGSVTGKLVLEPEKKDAPFDFALALEKVDIAQVSIDLGLPAGQTTGILAGKVELHGSSKKAERAEGKGELTLQNGQFKQFEFFQTLGQFLQISELANLRLREGRTEFRIADEKAFIESLVLDAPDLRLTAKGLARFDGKLALDAELGLSQRLAKQLPGFIRDNFNPPDATGGRAVAFKIMGRTDKPRTDLFDQLVGQRIGSQFDDLVSNIFGSKKKKEEPKEPKEARKKKKKDDEQKQVQAAAALVTTPETPKPAAEPAAESEQH